MFPPLSHRIRITIKDRVFNGKTVVVATHILNLRTISNSKEDGNVMKFYFYLIPSLYLFQFFYCIYLEFAKKRI